RGEQDETARGPVSEEQAEKPAREREKQALDQKLFHDRRAAGPGGETKRNLFSAARCLRDEKVRNVGAGDEEDQSDEDHEHSEGLGQLLASRGISLSSRKNHGVGFQELVPRVGW